MPSPVDGQFQKEMTSHSMSSYKSSRPSAPTATSQKQSKPLFDLDDDDSVPALDHVAESESDDDDVLFAIQASFDDARSRTKNEMQTASTDAPWAEPYANQGAISDDDPTSPLRPRTVLYAANIGPPSSNTTEESTTSFGTPSLLSAATPSVNDMSTGTDDIDRELDDVYIDTITPPLIESVVIAPTSNPEPNPQRTSETRTCVDLSCSCSQEFDVVNFDSDEEMEEVLPESDTPPQSARDNPVMLEPVLQVPGQAEVASQDLSADGIPLLHDSEDESEEEHIALSRSPSPALAANSEVGTSHVDESWDGAQEMDLHAEEGEFARFVSQVKGRDLEEIQREINDEIQSLNQQRKAAMRDSEDITQHMISQIMVS
jgi:DNA excision repair protein ERCC-5